MKEAPSFTEVRALLPHARAPAAARCAQGSGKGHGRQLLDHI